MTVTLCRDVLGALVCAGNARCALTQPSMSPQVPRELAGCPSLAWMSLGGNAACAVAPPPRSQIRAVAMDAMEMGKPLGSGASGDVFAATLASCWKLLSPVSTVVLWTCAKEPQRAQLSCMIERRLCTPAAGLQDGQDVAVKVFKGETSPDGQAADEIAVTCHVDHPNLTRSLFLPPCCSYTLVKLPAV